MKYPICQTENREGRKFCSRCGEPLQIICASSQAVNEPGEDYRGECVQPLAEQATKPSKPHSRKPSNIEPASFVNGCYQVKKLLGEGGKRRSILPTTPCWTGTPEQLQTIERILYNFYHGCQALR